jgi:phenylalanine-4-hydroxylase
MKVSDTLATDHPGFADERYRRRRDSIATISDSATATEPCPRVDYTEAEDEVWRTVSGALAPLHARYAVSEYNHGAERLALPTDRVPQLADVSDRLHDLTGWRVAAVPGLVPTRMFYGSLADRTFLSTQYVRHSSVPFYTPEPDIVHELIGHVNALASPRFADLYHAAGRASRAAAGDDAALERFSKVFWFTIEFGVVVEGGELRTYGAGLLSSFGEIQAFAEAEIRDFDIEAMAAADYDITHFQDVLYCAPSFAAAEAELHAFFDSF